MTGMDSNVLKSVVWFDKALAFFNNYFIRLGEVTCYCTLANDMCLERKTFWGAFDSAKNHKRQRRKRQSVTAKR